MKHSKKCVEANRGRRLSDCIGPPACEAVWKTPEPPVYFVSAADDGPNPPIGEPGPPGGTGPQPPALTQCRGPISPLPEDRTARKATPVWSGVLEYFPAAICAAARISKIGNDIHNPGEPLHHARGKSMDHTDCIGRHLIDFQALETFVASLGGWQPCRAEAATAEEHLGNLVWRVMAFAQEKLEEMGCAPLPPRARKAAGK